MGKGRIGVGRVRLGPFFRFARQAGLSQSVSR